MKNPSTEEVLERTREECLLAISNASTYGGKLAWYYTHCGEIEMVFQLGLITRDQFEVLHEDWRQHMPTP